MEAQRLPCPPASLNDQPIQLASCLQAIPAASDFSHPVILQPEQALSQTIYLKALTIPLYPPLQSECLQPINKLLPGQTGISLDSSNVPLILNPPLKSKGMDSLHTVIQKQPGTMSVVSGLPVFPQHSSPCSPLGSPSKCKNAGKCICKHCGRDCLKPSVLEKHIRSHTGERPFPCTTCGIAFKTQSNLYKHKRTQTHVNNARLSSESDGGSLLEEGEKMTECIAPSHKTKASDKNCDPQRAAVRHTALVTNEKHPLDISSSAVNAVFLVSENHWAAMDSSCHGGADQIVKESAKDSANPLQRKKTHQEQRSPTVSKPSQLQRQQATYSEKLWDSRSPDYKLKKCESTDSGYFSRSDSVEQQMLSPSPLHSLCEHSTEAEGDPAMNNLRCIAGNVSKADATEKAAGTSTAEKKKLEEHISKLISHNKALVDDTQLDNVRPRKTVLSKQGSIDLPMPYTYKDSFHFDLRPLDINRKKKLSVCSAKSTFTPVERSKPLSFHSVPTQFSTTIDCVPVTRSNSMPFIESTRRIKDHVDVIKVPASTSISTESGFSGLLQGKNFAISVIDFPTNHPRGLVRQAAVDDLALSNVNESSSIEEMKNAKKVAASGEGANAKYKKPSQRKLKMFSEEKWQVYGDETFKKIYQKMKSNQNAKKLKESEMAVISSSLSDGKGTVSCDEGPLPRDGRGLTSENLLSSTVDDTTKLSPKESEVSHPVSRDHSSKESTSNLAEFMETSHAIRDCQHSEITKAFVMDRCTELCVSKQDLSGNSQVVSLSGNCESGLQLQQPIDEKSKTQPNVTSPNNNALKEKHTQEKFIQCVLLREAISTNERDGTVEKEGFPLTQGVSISNQCNSEPGQEPQKVPSERKKLKVDKQKSKENTPLTSSPGSSISTEGTMELLDCHKPDVPTESVHSSVTGEDQKPMLGRNISGNSMECEETFEYPVMTSSNKTYVADTTHTPAISTLEQHRTEVANEYAYNLYALQRLTQQPYPVIRGTGVLSKTGDMAQMPTCTQHLIFNPVPSSVKRNDFLPKYILKYSQEIDNPGMPLILAEPENMSCVLPPSTSNGSPFPASNTRSASTSAADVFLCPLQLEMSHPIKTKESKWDVQTVWKPLVVCPPTVLETTRLDRRCHLQNLRQKETDVGSAHSRDTMGDERLTQDVDGHTIVCTSLTLGKKICFTTVYAGGFFISSDKTGQNPAVQLIHSGNSSVISVSSVVERTVLCGNTEKIKEWQAGIHSFPRLQDLPTCSVGNPRCLCNSSSMLYCHVLCTQEKEVSIQSGSSAVYQARNSKVSGMNVSFPTLNAEPQLTWCCLSRNLPLPTEQKGKKDSAYSSLHMCRDENICSKHSHTFCKMENTRKVDIGDRKTGALKTPIPFVPEGQQVEKLYPSAAGVDGLFKNRAEQTKAKGKLHKMRDHSRTKAKRSHKRKKLKINQKRYKGSYGHRCILLKAKQQSQQYWPRTGALETSSSDSPNSHEHCTKCLCSPAASQGNNENPQISYVVNEKASFPGKEDKIKEDVPISTSEHGSGSLFLQRCSTVPNIPIPKYSCPLASNVLAQKASCQDVCSLETHQREQQPNINSDHHWPSVGTRNFELINTNKSHPRNIVNLQPTDAISVGSKADCDKVESKHQHFTIQEPSVPIMGRKEQPTDGDLQMSSRNQYTSSVKTPSLASLKSKMLTETSVSNKQLSRSRHVQETKSSPSPLHHTDKSNYPMRSNSSHGKHSKSECPHFKTFTSAASPGPQCRSFQSMEMMNKQTHVEYDNTSSSDDEDRLVIEI